MTNKISIYYNDEGFRSLMKGPEIAKLEQEMMMSKLNEVQAAFLQEFGFQGSFEVQRVDTQSKRSRTTYRIVASDKRTGATLKSNSGWLGKFI